MSNVAEMESAWTTVASQTPQAPWEAIEQAADSLVAEPTRLESLRNVLDAFIAEPYQHHSFALLYVPAILELARPRLDDATRAEVGRYLVSAIIAAGKHDDDALLEILEYVARRYGRASLDAALEALQSLDHENAAYFYLWTTLYAVKEGDDADARRRVIDLCRRTLQQAVDKSIEADLAVMAAYILAELREADCRPAIESLIEATAGITDGPQKYAADEYRTALKLLDGQAAEDASLDVTADDAEFRKRIEEDWSTLHGFYEERERRAAIVAGFKAMADLAKQFVSDSRSENPAALAIADEFLRRAYVRTRGQLDQLYELALANVLLQDLPAFLSGDRAVFEQIPSTVIDLLEFLKDHGQLADIRGLTKWVRKHRNDVVAAAMDTARWSHEKLVASLSLHEGGRVATGDEIGSMLDGISGRRPRQRQLYQRTGRRTKRRVQPIVNKTQKVGRNDPCPCGSGKKFKKCCGSPTKS